MNRYLLLTFIIYNSLFCPTIYYVPQCGYEHEQIFNLADKRLNEEDRSEPFFNLRKGFNALGYDFKTTTLNEPLAHFAGLIVCNVPQDPKKLEWITRHHKTAQITLEPPTITPHYYNPHLSRNFDTIFSLLDDLVDNKKYVKFFYPQVRLTFNDIHIPFSEKKLCTLIASNKMVQQPGEMYSQRRAVIDFFEKHAPQDFDFYGHGWPKARHHCYKGDLALKSAALPHYKFSICYENVRLNGYITEKIFDSMIAGCIPVYWGAPNVKQFIPANCFIDRDKFQNNQELYQFLKNMSASEHAAYIEAIKEFLESPQAGFFSQEYFIHTMISYFIPHYDMTKVFTPTQLTKLLRTLSL